MCLVLGVYDNGSLAVSKTVSGGSNPSTPAVTSPNLPLRGVTIVYKKFGKYG